MRILKAVNNKEILNKEMIIAACEGKQRLVHVLITLGADLETRDNDNNTALHISAEEGHESVVRVLLQHGIDINIRGYDNFTPLITAARMGHLRVSRMLINNGAQLNLQDKHGDTALRDVAFFGHTSLVAELLERGADRDIKGQEDRTPLQEAQRKDHRDIAVILDRGNIQKSDQNAAKAVLAATEAGCPNVVSDLLKRGANMDTKNDMGETLIQIATRLPKTRKDEFEEYPYEIEKKSGIKPIGIRENIVKEAEKKSRELVKVFLSQSLNSHDPRAISQYLFDIVNFVNKDHFDSTVFGDEQNLFYKKYDKEEGKETLLQSVVNKGLVKEREEVLFVLKKVDLERYPNEQEDADYRLKKHVQKACSSSIGLRDCIQSIDEKYPWGNLKHKFRLFLSFFTFFMGTMLYGLDIYTDIRFSLDMFNYSKRNFTQELSLCRLDFEVELSTTIYVCRDNFNKSNCINSLAVLKKIADGCFQNKERFTDPNNWWIAGTVSATHCALPILVGFFLWGVVQICCKCDLKSWRNIPFPFVTRWYRFLLDVQLFKNYAWPDRNKDKATEAKYESTLKECMEEMDDHDQIVNLSLIIESSVEASFQFFFQTVYVFPTLILSVTDVSGTFDLKDLFNWKLFSIILSFASFALAFYRIR